MMKLLALFLVCVSLIWAVPVQQKPKDRIIGGQLANAGQFKYAAAITVRSKTSAYFCGGTILTNQWILTAGHCVDGAVSFTIILGSLDINGGDSSAVKLATDSYVLHPNYNAATYDNNIGLIELRQPVTFSDYIGPVDVLPTEELVENKRVLTLGWGQISDERSELSKELQYVSVSTLTNTECKLYYGNQISDHMICAEGNLNEGFCTGDSGGPLVQYVERGHVAVEGIATLLSQNGCESTDPSGYERVFPYVDWIRNTTGFL